MFINVTSRRSEYDEPAQGAQPARLADCFFFFFERYSPIHKLHVFAVKSKIYKAGTSLLQYTSNVRRVDRMRCSSIHFDFTHSYNSISFLLLDTGEEICISDATNEEKCNCGGRRQWRPVCFISVSLQFPCHF